VRPRKGLEGVQPYIHSKEEGIRFDLNENRFGPSPKVVEALKRVKPEDIYLYPEYGELIEKLAKYVGVGPENILLTNGADDAIRCVFDTYIEKGDEVLMPWPTFSMFEVYGCISGGEIRKIAYDEDLSFPMERFLEAIGERTKIAVIANPDNPTGSSISREEVKRIVKKATSSIVLLDETYHHLLGRSDAWLIKEFQNLIALQSFSKVFGLAGLRLGYLISDEENIDNIRRVNPPFSANSLAVMAGSAALDDLGYVEEVVKKIEEEKKFLKEGLERWGEVHMTHANFLLFKTGSPSTLQRRLAKRGVLVKDLSGLLDGYLRISVGTREDNEILLQALEEAMPPEAILFDMDGVLIDVSSSYLLAIKETAEHFLGEEIGMDEVDGYKRRGYNDEWELTQAILESRGLDIPMERIIEKFQQFYLGEDLDGLIKNESWLLGNDLLKRLKRDYKLGIVTGRPRREAEYALDRFRMMEYFDVLVAREDAPRKPDPSGIRLALQKLGVQRAVYVGDNLADIEAARGAGITPIAVGRLLGTKLFIKSVDELEEAL
jgi:histidinol-phosphate aminotransferase